MGLGKRLRLGDIIWMNLVAVVTLRWTSSAASSGPSSLTLWLIATLVFFIPQGLAVSELSSRFPEEGGLYRWTQRALGSKHGFVCGWCYWINNLVYFPSLLLYVSGNIAFTVNGLNPSLNIEKNKFFVVGVTLFCLWLVATLSIVGVKAGRWIQNLGGFGNWIPPAIVSVLAIAAYSLRGSANPINFTTLTPHLSSLGDFSFFSQICFALAGLELVSFMGGEIENPRRTITRGIFVSGILIAVVYFVGTLGILVSVPKEKVSLVNGILMAIQEVASPLGFSWLSPFSGVLIALAGIGCLMAWFSGAARVPYVVGVDKFLPSSFGKLHPKFGTPYIAIIVQTVMATLFTLFATVGSSGLESTYKVLVDMCLVLYFIPYCYLFFSLFLLRQNDLKSLETYEIPFGSIGKTLVAGCGMITTLIAISTSLFPSASEINWDVPLKTILGTFFMIMIGMVIYARQTTRKQPVAQF